MMTETKFTPGPWYVGAQNDALYIIDGPPSPTPYDGPIPKEYGPKVICSLEWRDMPIQANAHLISAAPDLYEALVTAKHALRHHDPEQPYMRAIRAALAKARGEA